MFSLSLRYNVCPFYFKHRDKLKKMNGVFINFNYISSYAVTVVWNIQYIENENQSFNKLQLQFVRM